MNHFHMPSISTTMKLRDLFEKLSYNYRIQLKYNLSKKI